MTRYRWVAHPSRSRATARPTPPGLSSIASPQPPSPPDHQALVDRALSASLWVWRPVTREERRPCLVHVSVGC